MTVARFHVVGAGMAGLSAAVSLARQGHPVTLHESSGHAGGRCRSFHDVHLDRRIDNGNHLVLSGNSAIQNYLAVTGATQQLAGLKDAAFPFIDLNSGDRWTVRPDRGAVPWSILTGSGRVPGTHLNEYLRGLRLARASKHDTAGDLLSGPGKLYERFWEPMIVGVMNTPADQAAAAPLWPVMKETFGKGREHCRPMLVKHGLSETFVDPALACLKSAGVEIHFNRRLRTIEWLDGRANILCFADDEEALRHADVAILALPAWSVAGLLPEFEGPTTSQAIVNAHFLLPEPVPEGPSFIGLVGGTSQWIFVRHDVASVTISAADDLADQPAEKIAETVWPEVCQALNLSGATLPTHRIIKEKRATICQTPKEMLRRPGVSTRWPNLFLAGDWTATGLPATIEGAIRSGVTAADAAITFAAQA